MLRKSKIIIPVLVLLFTVVGVDKIHANVISLEDYRKQAQKTDPAFQAAKKAREGADESEDGYSIMTDTLVMGKAIYSDDRRPTQNPTFQGSRTEARTASIGLQKQFLFGPKFSVQQNFAHVQIYDASPGAIPTPDYYDWYPSAELSIPLWKNFGGTLVRAEQEKFKAQTQAQSIQSDLDYIKASSRIDMAYHELNAARELLSLQKEILSRAEKIATWVTTQNRRGLLDATDVHQAVAAVTLRKIQLESALQSEASARRVFNSLRGVEGDQVIESLVPQELLESSLLLDGQVKRTRKEEKLLQLSSEMQQQTFRTNAEMTRATVDLQAYSAWYGRDADFAKSQSEMNSNSQPHWYVGIHFAAPLDAPKYLRVHRGLEKLYASEDIRERGLLRDQKLTWQDFVEQGKSIHNQNKLLRVLEETQKKKADAERTRFQRGRSTTFQLLNFEQDYISAKSQRIQIELSARRFIHEIEKFD